MLGEILKTMDQVEVHAENSVLVELKQIESMKERTDVDPEKLTIRSFFKCNTILIRNSAAPVQPDSSKRIRITSELRQFFTNIPTLKQDDREKLEKELKAFEAHCKKFAQFIKKSTKTRLKTNTVLL